MLISSRLNVFGTESVKIHGSFEIKMLNQPSESWVFLDHFPLDTLHL